MSISRVCFILLSGDVLLISIGKAYKSNISWMIWLQSSLKHGYEEGAKLASWRRSKTLKVGRLCCNKETSELFQQDSSSEKLTETSEGRHVLCSTKHCSRTINKITFLVVEVVIITGEVPVLGQMAVLILMDIKPQKKFFVLHAWCSSLFRVHLGEVSCVPGSSLNMIHAQWMSFSE